MTFRNLARCRLSVMLAAVAAAFLSLAVTASLHAAEAQWKVGLAEVNISPTEPVMLLGYPDRKGPSTKVAADIFAKALAIEDAQGNRGVIVTADLVGFQAMVTTNPVCQRIHKRTGLERNQLIFNASHSHTGPVVSLKPILRYNVSYPEMTPEDARRTVAYSRRLQDQLVDVVERALKDVQPVRLSWGAGKVDFPVSRRMSTPKGVVMSANQKGLADKTVPVLRIDDPSGKLRAVLFGCACHNVAAGGTNEVNGDYAGYAQTWLQKRYPGVRAMFMAGCGADANPHPMGSLDLAKSHGGELGSEASRVLEGKLEPVRGPLKIEMAEPELPLQELTRQDLRQYLPLPNFQARTAAQMLRVLDSGEKLITSYRAPVYVWQFGDDLTLVALPAEPVAQYVPLLQQALGREKLWIAGFNNDCFGYLPTAKIVQEGGHEAIGLTFWSYADSLSKYVGFFSPKVEDVIVDTVRQLAATAGRPMPQAR